MVSSCAAIKPGFLDSGPIETIGPALGMTAARCGRGVCATLKLKRDSSLRGLARKKRAQEKARPLRSE